MKGDDRNREVTIGKSTGEREGRGGDMIVRDLVYYGVMVMVS